MLNQKTVMKEEFLKVKFNSYANYENSEGQTKDDTFRYKSLRAVIP